MSKNNSKPEHLQLGLHVRVILLIILSCFCTGCWKKKVAEKADTQTKDASASSKVDAVEPQVLLAPNLLTSFAQ